VWQRNNYIKGIENCDSKAVNDEVLKRTFIQLYNDMVEDKGSFYAQKVVHTLEGRVRDHTGFKSYLRNNKISSNKYLLRVPH